MEKGVLALADGTRYEGYWNGIEASGELCFNTAMTGYQETYTDPSYFNQILISTHVHIGNYGCNKTEYESHRPQISGLVVRSIETFGYRTKGETVGLVEWLNRFNVPFLSGIDTRALVRKLRKNGSQNAIITSALCSDEEITKKTNAVPSMQGLSLAKEVSRKQFDDYGNPESDIRIACIDFGIKQSIINQLVGLGSYCRVFPMHSSINELMSFNPHGFFLSNGPGDPSSMHEVIELIQELLKTRRPIFGICLGHQLLGLSLGLKTFKMHHGHRGLNHPIINTLTGKGEITSQNHGFSIVLDDLNNQEDIIVTHKHLNDSSIAGIRHKYQPAFSVQYHPESSPGPHDSRYLFEEFYQYLREACR